MMIGDGFEEWYQREHPRLLTSLIVITANVDTALDVTDEAFTRACERWHRVQTMDNPTGWTYRTALNVLHRRQRRTAIEARLLRRVAEPTWERPEDWSIDVWDALKALPTRQRTAIALRFVADLPSTEISRAMGITPGTVSSTLSDARARLARTLNPQEAPDG